MRHSRAIEKFTMREKRQFQEMLGMYDEKLYKKSIKIADNLLENNPTHAETRAFRALSLSGLGKMKEAVKEIKAVLMKNMMNYTCWHIMGIVHRKEKEYDQARRAYLFALKCDPKNEQALRELCQLQIHMRDFEGFQDTTRKQLTLKPGIISHWINLSVASYLSKNYEGCVSTVDDLLTFQKEMTSATRLNPPQLNEIILLAIRAYMAQNKYTEALAFLGQNQEQIVDQVAKNDYKGKIHCVLGQVSQSVDAFEELLLLNSANLNTFKKIINAKGVTLPEDIKEKLSDEDQEKVKTILDQYVEEYPKSNSHLRIGLRYLYGDNFNSYLDRYMRPLIIKGVPSLIMDLREFYQIPEKVEIMGQYLQSALHQIDTDMTLKAGDEEEQDPTVQLWLLYFTAQHNLFQNKLTEAMAFVNKAIEHTPTLLELYTLKGQIYQKAGDRQRSAELFEIARNLDKADRAINAISAMQTLKIGNVEQGINIMDIFVKDCGYDVSIHDNQTMWFEQMTGRAHYTNNDLRKALKEFKYVQLHAEHIVQDHFDYYQYMLRKLTLKSLEDLMTFADKTLRQNRTIIKNAISYLCLQNKVEKKKDQERATFEPQMQEYLESEDYAKLKETLSKAEDEDEYKNDSDPQGFFTYKKLLDGELDLTDWVETVTQVNDNADLNAKAIPCFAQKGKWLSALKSAICLKEKHADHPKTAAALVKLFKKWLSMTDEQKLQACGKDQRILSVAVSEISALGCPQAESDLASWFASNRVTGSARPLEECHEHLKLSLRVLGVTPSADWGAQALQALSDNPQKTLSVWQVIKMHKTLVKTGLNGVDTAFKAKAMELFPLSTYFASQ